MLNSCVLYCSQPEYAGYKLSKGTLAHLASSLATELGPRGIRVNSVAPSLHLRGRQQGLLRLAGLRGAASPTRRSTAQKADPDRPQAAGHARGGRPRDALPRQRPGLGGHRARCSTSTAASSMTTDCSVTRGADVGSYDDIAAAAVRTTGLDDFGGTAHEEGLRVLVEDLGSPEAGLTAARATTSSAREVKSALVGRLLTQARFTEHPEHADVPIERPIFVMGLPRTGTTALHRLLHADPAHQGLEMWLTAVPPAAAAARDLGGATRSSPRCSRRSPSTTSRTPSSWGSTTWMPPRSRSAGGCCGRPGKSISYESLANVPRYSAWLAGQDWTDAYARHKAEPAADRAQRPRQAVGAEEPVAPDGARRADDGLPRRADRLHPPRPGHLRSPRRARCPPRRPRATPRRSSATTIGRTQLDMLVPVRRTRSTTRGRRTTRTQFVDVDYREFVQDPVATTRGIYDAFGLDWTPEAAAAVGEIDRESRRAGSARRTATPSTTTGSPRPRCARRSRPDRTPGVAVPGCAYLRRIGVTSRALPGSTRPRLNRTHHSERDTHGSSHTTPTAARPPAATTTHRHLPTAPSGGADHASARLRT